MTRRQYLMMRDKLYKVAGELGTFAEGDLKIDHNGDIDEASTRMGDVLDAFDSLGRQMGVIDDYNNTVQVRLKKQGAIK